MLDLSNKISKSYSKSPERKENINTPNIRTWGVNRPHQNKSTARLRKDADELDTSQTNTLAHGRKLMKSQATLHKSTSPNVTQKSINIGKTPHVINIDLRNAKGKQSSEILVNPPMIFASKVRAKPDYTYHISKSPKKEVTEDVRKALFTYDFNKEYLAQSKDRTAKTKVNLPVDHLVQQSMKRLNFM